MSRPCSQLNSKVIRDKAECHIIAEIEKTYSVVAFKCVWRVKDDEIQRAWNWICEKRDDCDLTLSKLSEVCFLFSAISTSKLGRKKKKNKASDEAGRRERRRPNRRICDQSLADFITRETNFTSNFILGGVPNSQWFRSKSIQDSTSLGKCGLEFYLSRASRKKSSHHLNQLCQVLKDHQNPCLMNFVETSYQHCLT